MRIPRGEPEPETTPEPKAEPENSNSHPNAEPVPAWPAAHDEWKAAWELHYIGFGVVFLLLAVWSVLALIRARNTPLLVTRRFCYAVNCLLIVFGTTRALALFLYPYEVVDNTGGTPIVLERLLFGIGFPCIIAGFTLIHFAFLEAAKVSFSNRRIQSLRFICAVIGVHFILVFVAEIVTSYVAKTSALIIVCMMYFVVCALAVSVSVFYSGFHVMNESKTHRRTLKRISVRGDGGNSTKSARNGSTYSNRKSNTNKVARVTMVTASLGLACAAVQIYAIAGVFKVRSGGYKQPPDPWPWWVYVTLFRLTELGLAITMAYTVSQPKKGGSNLHEFLQCCSAPTRSRRDTYTDSALTTSDNVARDYQVTSYA